MVVAPPLIVVSGVAFIAARRSPRSPRVPMTVCGPRRTGIRHHVLHSPQLSSRRSVQELNVFHHL